MSDFKILNIFNNSIEIPLGKGISINISSEALIDFLTNIEQPKANEISKILSEKLYFQKRLSELNSFITELKSIIYEDLDGVYILKDTLDINRTQSLIDLLDKYNKSLFGLT